MPARDKLQPDREALAREARRNAERGMPGEVEDVEIGAQATRRSPAGLPFTAIGSSTACVAASGGRLMVGVATSSQRSNQPCTLRKNSVRFTVAARSCCPVYAPPARMPAAKPGSIFDSTSASFAK